LLSVKLFANALSFFLKFKITSLQLYTLFFKFSSVRVGCTQCLALREQEIARVPILDIDDIAHLSERADPLQQNNLHFNPVLSLLCLFG